MRRGDLASYDGASNPATALPRGFARVRHHGSADGTGYASAWRSHPARAHAADVGRVRRRPRPVPRWGFESTKTCVESA